MGAFVRLPFGTANVVRPLADMVHGTARAPVEPSHPAPRERAPAEPIRRGIGLADFVPR